MSWDLYKDLRIRKEASQTNKYASKKWVQKGTFLSHI
jgi:hypothetical protein